MSGFLRTIYLGAMMGDNDLILKITKYNRALRAADERLRRVEEAVKKPPSGMITCLRGDIQIKNPNDRWQPVEKRAFLYAGAVVETGPGSSADVCFRNGAQVDLEPDCAFRLIAGSPPVLEKVGGAVHGYPAR